MYDLRVVLLYTSCFYLQIIIPAATYKNRKLKI